MIIYLISTGDPLASSSGVGVLVGGIARQLAISHTVYIISASPTKMATPHLQATRYLDSIKIFTIGVPNLDSLFNRYNHADYHNAKIDTIVAQIFQTEKPDIVHLHAVQGIGAGVIDVAKKYGAKTTLTMHDWWWIDPNFFLVDLNGNRMELSTYCLHDDLLRYGLVLSKNFIQTRSRYLNNQLKKIDRITACSHFLANSISKITGFSVGTLENFIEVDQRSSPRKQFEEGSALRFAFFGGLSQLKGFELLYRAMTQIHYSHFQLHVYGVGTSTLFKIRKTDRSSVGFKVLSTLIGSLIKDLTLTIKQLIPSKITYHRVIDHDKLRSEMSKYDFIVVPSMMTESFSLVAHEALSLPRPVLASNHGNLGIIIKPYDNGLTFEAGSVDDLVFALREMRRLIRINSFSALKPRSIRSARVYSQELMDLYNEILDLTN